MRTSPHGPPDGPHRRGLAIGLIAGAVVIIAALAIAVIVFVTQKEPAQIATESAPRVTIAAMPALTAAPPTSPSLIGPTVPRTRVETAAPTTTPSPSEPPTTAAQVTPTERSIPMNAWAVILGSLDTEGRAAQQLTDVRGVAPNARILNSNDVGSLKPGYWFVYQGNYATPDAALAACRSMGYSHRNDCYAAYLSTDPADRARRAYPD